jgi:N-acetylmuramoyl-L-alanine amidase
MKKKIDTFVLHCSESVFGDAALIDKWHKERTPPFKLIGYNHVILNGCRKSEKYLKEDDGLLEAGRPINMDTWIEESEIGAHALGFNDHSVSACLIGGAGGSLSAFTIPQYQTALILGSFWSKAIPGINILGHCETGSPKLCPVISMEMYRDRLKYFLKGDASLQEVKKDIEINGL